MNGRNEAFKEVEALTRSVMTLDEKLDRIERGAGSVGVGQSTVNLNAGGIGVWLAVSACAVSVSLTIVAVIFGALAISQLGQQFNNQSREVGRMQDHLTAIYMMAPHLKPKEQTHVIDNHHPDPAAKEAEAP